MRRLGRAGIVVALLLLPAAAHAADVEWSVTKRNGRAYLSGMPNVSEVDYEFWAHCRADGSIEVGAAAEAHVGKGRGEAVTLKLASAGKAVTLTGVSRESANVRADASSFTNVSSQISNDAYWFPMSGLS